jgi:hypothetical protein
MNPVRLSAVKRLLIGLLFAATLANACAGLLTIAAQSRYAPITAKTVFDGD